MNNEYCSKCDTQYDSDYQSCNYDVNSSLNESPRFHYLIVCDGHFTATVPNGTALDRMVRDALRRGWAVKIELREEPAPRHGR